MITLTDIERAIDHTLLDPLAGGRDIFQFAVEAKDSQVACLCVPPRYIQEAVEGSEGKLPICTVVGFPHGFHHRWIKAAEAKQAIQDGAQEIDMVLPLALIRFQDDRGILDEVAAVREAIGAEKTLKVIVESGALNSAELAYISELLSNSSADFIKTSTGFKYPGACLDDVQLMKHIIGNRLRIKASGGIADLESAKAYLSMGVDRLGSSRLLKLCKEE